MTDKETESDILWYVQFSQYMSNHIKPGWRGVSEVKYLSQVHNALAIVGLEPTTYIDHESCSLPTELHEPLYTYYLFIGNRNLFQWTKRPLTSHLLQILRSSWLLIWVRKVCTILFYFTSYIPCIVVLLTVLLWHVPLFPKYKFK